MKTGTGAVVDEGGAPGKTGRAAVGHGHEAVKKSSLQVSMRRLQTGSCNTGMGVAVDASL